MKHTPFTHIFLIAAFIFNAIEPCPIAQADEITLPVPGVMVHLSPPLNPPTLKGIKVHPDNPFRFDFILDRGDNQLSNDQLKNESSKLIKYFLAALTIPENDLWVNLSPYEKNRIIPQNFGLTEMGRDLLAEDYMLKQITASLIYPEGEVGKKFWKRIYTEAQKRYGTTNIPINTFNKVWIVPEKAVVYDNAKSASAYVVEAKLKVMLEEDYLSLEKHTAISPFLFRERVRRGSDEISSLGSQVVRELVIPELTREVNENKNFAQLRQVYNSLILATWYKKKIKDSLLDQVYADKNKVAGVNIADPQEKQRIYQRYLKAFKKGVFNYIQHDIDEVTHEQIPRKYFSGGILWNMKDEKFISSFPDSAMINRNDLNLVEVNIKPDLAMAENNLYNIKLNPNYINAQEIIERLRTLKSNDDESIDHIFTDTKYRLRELNNFFIHFNDLPEILGLKAQILASLPEDRWSSDNNSELRNDSLIQQLTNSFLSDLSVKKRMLVWQALKEISVNKISKSNIERFKLGIPLVLNGGFNNLASFIDLQNAVGQFELHIEIIRPNENMPPMVLLFKNYEYRAMPRFDSISVVTGHTHGFLSPLEHSDADQEAAEQLADLNIPEFILTVNKNYKEKNLRGDLVSKDVVQLALFNTVQKSWEYYKDPRPQGQQRIKDKLVNLGVIKKESRKNIVANRAMSSLQVESKNLSTRVDELELELKKMAGSTDQIVGIDLNALLGSNRDYEGVLDKLKIAKNQNRIMRLNVSRLSKENGFLDVALALDQVASNIASNYYNYKSNDYWRLQRILKEQLRNAVAHGNKQDLTKPVYLFSSEKGKTFYIVDFANADQSHYGPSNLHGDKMGNILSRERGRISRPIAIIGTDGHQLGAYVRVDYDSIQNPAMKSNLIKSNVIKRNGGIDLTPANMHLQIRNSGIEIKFHLNPAQLVQLQNAPGFVPVIISIQPMNNLRQFLGVTATTAH